MEPYFTVAIPFAPHEFRTPFHPDTDVGPFSTLTRGVFKTRAEAIAWARENLNGTPYTIKLEGGPDNGAAPPWLSDVAQALGYVRPDGAPLALNWSQALEAIRELRRGRDYWQGKAAALSVSEG